MHTSHKRLLPDPSGSFLIIMPRWLRRAQRRKSRFRSLCEPADVTLDPWPGRATVTRMITGTRHGEPTTGLQHLQRRIGLVPTVDRRGDTEERRGATQQYSRDRRVHRTPRVILPTPHLDRAAALPARYVGPLDTFGAEKPHDRMGSTRCCHRIGSLI